MHLKKKGFKYNGKFLKCVMVEIIWYQCVFDVHYMIPVIYTTYVFVVMCELRTGLAVYVFYFHEKRVLWVVPMVANQVEY